MSSWEDHEEMIDDQYLMESIEEDQKLEAGSSEVDEDDHGHDDDEESEES
jgi:hypothetical protein